MGRVDLKKYPDYDGLMDEMKVAGVEALSVELGGCEGCDGCGVPVISGMTNTHDVRVQYCGVHRTWGLEIIPMTAPKMVDDWRRITTRKRADIAPMLRYIIADEEV